MNDVGRRLRQLRKKRGLKQSEAGAMLGVSGNAVSLWERGRSNMTMENLIGICKELDVSAEWLLLGDDRLQRIIDLPEPQRTQVRAGIDALLALAERVATRVN